MGKFRVGGSWVDDGSTMCALSMASLRHTMPRTFRSMFSIQLHVSVNPFNSLSAI